MKKTAKHAGGRPPLGDKAMLQPVTVRFPVAMMDEIEAIQAARMDQPDKGQVIRELVALALEMRRKRGK